jgi:hypothetical protein
VEQATDICNTFYIDSSWVLVSRHRREVSPLARRVMLQPVSAPLQGGLRFFPPPYPHRHRLAFRLSYFPSGKERYGLTTFRKVDRNGLGALSPPGALRVHDRVLSRPGTRSGAFWLKPVSILGLLLITTFIESSHVCTIPPIQPPLRLMLADTPSPHGSGASRVTVGTMSAGSVRVVTLPHICVGYC